MKKFLKSFLPSLAISLGIALFVILIAVFTILLDGGELKLLDFRFYMKSPPSKVAPPELRNDIVIVSIDDFSLFNMESEVGRWPWPRAVHARFIKNLMKAKPKAIFFDVFFTEPQLTLFEKIDRVFGLPGISYMLLPSPSEVINKAFQLTGGNALSPQEKEILEYFIEMMLGDNDALLAEATKEAGCVFYDYFFTKGVATKGIERRIAIVDKFAYPAKNVPGIEKMPEWDGTITPPIEKIGKWAKGLGAANIIPDPDGVNRTMPLIIKWRGKLYPSIDLLLVMHALGLKKEDVSFDINKGIIKAGNIKIPIDNRGHMLINFLGGVQTFPYIPYAQIYFADRDPELMKQIKAFFKDKIVLVGATAPGLYDLWNSPLQQMPGIEHHANTINTILQQIFIKPVPLSVNIAIILAVAVLLAIALPLAPPLPSFGIWLILVLIYASVSVYVFAAHRIWIWMAAPLTQMVLGFFGITTWRVLTEEKEKRQIKGAFQKYVAPQVVNEILKDPSKLALGGERRFMSVLFSDVRSFTTYSETHTPEEVVSILNEYLTEMTDIIFKNGGTLDKYVGDEIMALFGAPIPYKDHAILACKTGLEMVQRLKELQEKWKAEGKDPIDMGVGINTGIMVVGNMGSSHIMDYTVIGDDVNLGARVEALTRNYPGVYIIITEFTLEELKKELQLLRSGQTDGFFLTKDKFPYADVDVEYLDEVIVKGKTKPVKIFSLKGFK